MRSSILLACVMASALSACATVNVQDLAANGTVSTQETVAAKRDNVVIRSADALYEKFTDRGWTAKPVSKPISKASAILLGGLRKGEALIKNTGYLKSADNLDTVRLDLKEASEEARRTVKAADVFLTMSEADADLSEELKHLEKALVSCRKSERLFKRALEANAVSDIDAELGMLSHSVDALRDVTNQYGRHVRQQNLMVVGTSAS